MPLDEDLKVKHSKFIEKENLASRITEACEKARSGRLMTFTNDSKCQIIKCYSYDDSSCLK